MIPDFYYGVTAGVIDYDIETYPNIFTFTAIHDDGTEWYFEISDWCNDVHRLCGYLDTVKTQGAELAGYNNIGFDYPVIHHIYNSRNAFITAAEIYNKAMSIINAPHNAKFAHMVWESEWVVPQIDIFKIHHFDNISKATSLKVLEFNMRSENIEDLPFDVGLHLTREQADVLKTYNRHDVSETQKFRNFSADRIRFRRELSERYNKNFMNHNDTKIGKDFFIMQLEEVDPGCCYKKINGRRQIQQTKRDQIRLGEVILPYVQFNEPEFQRVLQWFQQRVIAETKGSIKGLSCTVRGFQFDFGTGGIHGSVDSQIVYSDDQWIIEDWDVASYYPNLAISNGFHPAHLGDTFCTIYKDVYEQRKQYKKGTAENAMLKLALNGVYGDSNNQYSPFYDPQYTMSITINGQLLLCMLAEKLFQLDSLQMIQINTDGLTVRYPRVYKDWVHDVATWWEQLTKLELEHVEYSRFFVRDVNNYIAECTDGKLKRKGAYCHMTPIHDPENNDLDWHQNHSALVVPKAAEAALVQGVDIREFIENHEDVMDFMLRTKVPRSSSLEWGGDVVQNIVRYYISTDGKILEKVMPAAGPVGEYKRANKLTDQYFDSVMQEIGDGVWDERIHTKNKSVYEERRSGITTGWTVQLCNGLDSYEFILFSEIVNYEWYIKEAEKLVKPLLQDSE